MLDNLSKTSTCLVNCLRQTVQNILTSYLERICTSNFTNCNDTNMNAKFIFKIHGKHYTILIVVDY